MKWPPPIPLLWECEIPLHKPVAIAASTADPFALIISTPTFEQNSESEATENFLYFPKIDEPRKS